MSMRGEDGIIESEIEIPHTAGDSAIGWSADECREYMEWSFRNDIQRFATLYGWDAVDSMIETARQGQV